MIYKYVFGTPFDTESIIKDIEETSGNLPYLKMEGDKFIYDFSKDDIVYGLGEQIRGINKRGWKYVNFNYDNPHHHEDTNSLYGSHNFFIVSGKELFGVYLDYPGKVTYDIGYEEISKMVIVPEDMNLNVYIFEGETIKDIVKEFRSIIGKSYIPPLWAFGFGQSRWGYKNEADIREVAAKYKEAGIPIDSIYMDIDYMENFKDFTVDSEKFPDLSKLAKDMKDEGIHLVPIIDAGVKIEDGYDVYEEGVKNNYFCKNEDGSDFVGAVWPGRVHFPDFLNRDARRWFGLKYKNLTDLGIDGFWNDMNEPAIFYTDEHLAETLSEVNRLNNGNMGITEFFKMTDMVGGLNGNSSYYDKFYHNVNGTMVKHSKVHNIYGMNMTRSAYEALKEINPDTRTLFFSRSSFVGAHRYGGIWQGDNKSWWSHILQSMQQLPALNMAGFLFIGSDVGGFGCNTTEDLMIRYIQYSMFTPLLRNHSADGTRRQELYRFTTVDIMREMIKIRYSLIPYLYSEFLKAQINDEMMFRPLAFDYPEDKDASNVDDQLFLGNEIMIAPIYKQNAKGRYVYLPERMMLIRMRKYDDYETVIYEKGHHYINSELNELVFFIRDNKSVPLYEAKKNSDKISSIIGFKNTNYSLYTDDGITFDEGTRKVIDIKNT